MCRATEGVLGTSVGYKRSLIDFNCVGGYGVLF